MNPIARSLLLFLLTFYGLHTWTVAADAPQLTVLFSSIKGIGGIVPQRTSHYQISDQVEVDPPYYVFTITSASGESYQVKGINGLIKATHEISVIEVFRATPQGSQVWAGAKDSLAGLGQGGKQIILHPGDSTLAIGRSVARTGRTVGRLLTGIVKRDPTSSTGKNLSETPGGILASEQARQAAYDLQLDVYSGNPYVQAVLGEIAQKRLAGSLGVTAAKMAANLIVPGSGYVAKLSTGALTPGGYVEATELAIRNNPPAELYLEMQKQLAVSLGKEEDCLEARLLEALMQNPNYTPSQKAYVTLYLEQTADLQNFDKAITTLASARTVEDAEVMFLQMQLISASHRFGRRYAAFACGNQRIAGQLGRGDVVMILPYDYADDNEGMRSEVRDVPYSKISRNIWLLGDHTSAFERMMSTQNITSVQDNILHYEAFRQTAAQPVRVK